MPSKKITILSSLLIIFCFLFLAPAVLAATAQTPPVLQLPNPRIQIPGFEKFSEVPPVKEINPKTGQEEYYYYIPWLGEYISSIYKYGVGLAAVLALIMLMVAGLTYIMAGGVPDKINKAKSLMGGAIFGLILALGSYLVLYTINPALVTFKAIKIKWIAPVVQEGDNHCTLPGDKTESSLVHYSGEFKWGACCNECKQYFPSAPDIDLEKMKELQKGRQYFLEETKCSDKPNECTGGGIKGYKTHEEWKYAETTLKALLDEIYWQISGEIATITGGGKGLACGTEYDSSLCFQPKGSCHYGGSDAAGKYSCAIDISNVESYTSMVRLLRTKIKTPIESFYCQYDGWQSNNCQKIEEAAIKSIHISVPGCGVCADSAIKPTTKCYEEQLVAPIPSMTGLEISSTCSDPRLLPSTITALQDAALKAFQEKETETLVLTSAFRTWKKQKELYDCYEGRQPAGCTSGCICPLNCRTCNEAAEPSCSGTASHQAGKAVDVCLKDKNCDMMTNPYIDDDTTKKLKTIMESSGFVGITSEWWHFKIP